MATITPSTIEQPGVDGAAQDVQLWPTPDCRSPCRRRRTGPASRARPGPHGEVQPGRDRRARSHARGDEDAISSPG